MRLVRLTSALGLVLAFACGDDDGTNVDGPDAGPAVDAAPRPDSDVRPTTGTCGIVVAPILPFGGAPTALPEDFAGSTVIFSNPDGTLIDVATTNDKGEASIDACVRDTMITAIVQDAEFLLPATSFGAEPPPPTPVGPLMIVTYVGVDPNDTVFWGDNTIVPDPGPSYANISATLDQDLSAFPDATRVTIQVGSGRTHYPLVNSDQGWDTESCSSNRSESLDVTGVIDETESVQRFELDRGCVQPDMSGDALAMLWDGGALLATATASVNVSFGTAALDVDIPVTMGPWQAADGIEDALIVTNLPTSVDEGGAFVQHAIGNVAFTGASTGFGSGDVVSSRTFYGTPDGFANSTIANAAATLSQLPVRRTQLAQAGPYADTTEIDMSQRLPRIAGALVTRDEPTRPRISWLSDGTLDDANTGIIVSLLTTPATPEPVAIWTIVTSDPAAGSVQGPVLPEAALETLYGDVSINVYPVAASFFGFNYQTFNDFITTRGFNPNIQFLPSDGMHLFLPAPMPVDTGGDTGAELSVATKSSWVDVALLNALFGIDP